MVSLDVSPVATKGCWEKSASRLVLLSMRDRGTRGLCRQIDHLPRRLARQILALRPTWEVNKAVSGGGRRRQARGTRKGGNWAGRSVSRGLRGPSLGRSGDGQRTPIVREGSSRDSRTTWPLPECLCVWDSRRRLQLRPLNCTYTIRGGSKNSWRGGGVRGKNGGGGKPPTPWIRHWQSCTNTHIAGRGYRIRAAPKTFAWRLSK